MVLTYPEKKVIYAKYGRENGRIHIDEIEETLKNTIDINKEAKRNQENIMTANENFLEGLGQF